MEFASGVENFEMAPKVLGNLCTPVVKGRNFKSSCATVRFSRRSLSHGFRQWCEIWKARSFFVNDIVASWQRKSVKPNTHTHTHIRTLTHAHTQRAVHLKVDHTMAKERFLPITTTCCSCLALLAAITSLFRPTSLVSYATRKSLFPIRVKRTLAKYLVDIAWACVVERPFTPLLNVTEHNLTEHVNECTSFAL